MPHKLDESPSPELNPAQIHIPNICTALVRLAQCRFNEAPGIERFAQLLDKSVARQRCHTATLAAPRSSVEPPPPLQFG